MIGTRQRGGSEARNLWRAKACLRRKSVAVFIMARGPYHDVPRATSGNSVRREEFFHPTPRLPLKVRGRMWQG